MHLLRDDPECLARGYYSRQRNHRRSKLGSLPPVFRIAWCCTVDLVYLQSTRGPNSTPVLFADHELRRRVVEPLTAMDSGNKAAISDFSSSCCSAFCSVAAVAVLSVTAAVLF
ncbi:hypothetical protein RHGRI_001649 [Rhododendron griersonianum]|uniref:Uncharacterized protein n=1 Tax=Rhododendron griersonianum TaxID=479676 RepID=A0AAV6LLF0_9ERIC|nr:hypothetical protein RHGRI_001649 [Rhododendron griersonianum]